MTSPRRILLDAAATFALLLFLATAALWLRSYLASDAVQRYGPPSPSTGVARIVDVSTGRGALLVSIDAMQRRTADAPQFVPPYVRWSIGQHPRPAGPIPNHPAMTSWSALGLSVHHTVYDTSGVHRDRTAVLFPFWLLTLAAAALALPQFLAAVRRHRHRRRAARGACPACGYDLRATPDRCPECGAIPNPAAAAKG